MSALVDVDAEFAAVGAAAESACAAAAQLGAHAQKTDVERLCTAYGDVVLAAVRCVAILDDFCYRTARPVVHTGRRLVRTHDVRPALAGFDALAQTAEAARGVHPDAAPMLRLQERLLLCTVAQRGPGTPLAADRARTALRMAMSRYGVTAADAPMPPGGRHVCGDACVAIAKRVAGAFARRGASGDQRVRGVVCKLALVEAGAVMGCTTASAALVLSGEDRRACFGDARRRIALGEQLDVLLDALEDVDEASNGVDAMYWCIRAVSLPSPAPGPTGVCDVIACVLGCINPLERALVQAACGDAAYALVRGHADKLLEAVRVARTSGALAWLLARLSAARAMESIGKRRWMDPDDTVAALAESKLELGFY